MKILIEIFEMEFFVGLPKTDLLLARDALRRSRAVEKDTHYVIIGASGFLGKWLSGVFSFEAENHPSSTFSFLTTKVDHLEDLGKLNQKNLQILHTLNFQRNSMKNFDRLRTVVVFSATSTYSKFIKKQSNQSYSIEILKSVLSKVSEENLTVVHLSSGGIYDKAKIPISYDSIPANSDIIESSENEYLYEKLEIEKWLEKLKTNRNVLIRNPRLFTFYGPGYPKDRGFAFSDFIFNAVEGNDLIIHSNPNNMRSYLYPVDAVAQIMEFCKIEPPFYSQVGSALPISIGELAEKISKRFNVKVQYSANCEPIEKYVPQDVKPDSIVKLDEGIEKWYMWIKERAQFSC